MHGVWFCKILIKLMIQIYQALGVISMQYVVIMDGPDVHILENRVLLLYIFDHGGRESAHFFQKSNLFPRGKRC